MRSALARVVPATVLLAALAVTGGIAQAATTPTPAATAASTGGATLDAEAQLTGSGPFTAWLGGAAKRTYVLTVVNNGLEPVTDPQLILTVGKSANPTTVLAQPSIGTIAPGQSIQYRLPVTLKAPAFGQYRVKATFPGGTPPVTTTTTTSSYPWLLFFVGWLLLQPLLLGLYKRRPNVEQEDEDPFDARQPELEPALVGAPAYDASDAALYDAFDAAPDFLPPYEPAPAPAAAAAAAEPVYTPLDDPAYAVEQVAQVAQVAAYPPPDPTTALAPYVSSELVPNYQPVFGVSDMRTYLDPQGTAATPAPVTPRVVVGGARRPPAPPQV